MDKSVGQDLAAGRSARGPGSRATQEKLLAAAGELIAELGWGRVTTRAVAERAGLPHGAVSYHFRGKQELLVEASLFAMSSAVPLDQFAALSGVQELIGLIRAEIGGGAATTASLSRLMFEAMREAERDEALRARMSALLGDYRQVVVGLVSADQRQGAIPAAIPARGLATVLSALGDGLLLHVLIDPDLDVSEALDTLRALLAPH